MNVTIRKSTIDDLKSLEIIEQRCFPEFKRSTRKMLRLSLSSSSQEVWIAETGSGKKKKAAGCMILHLHPRTLRVFSIGVLPEFQRAGIGAKLITQACNLAMARACEKVSLEARALDIRLVEWYKKAGFVVTDHLKDYYKDGEDAVKMVFVVSRPKTSALISNIIVVDSASKWKLDVDGVMVISARSYISDTAYQTVKNVRIFNLCNSYRYQSLGYYVSLLASAREHRAIPSVTTIRDFKNLSVIRAIANDIDDLLQQSLEKVKENKFLLNIYFGHTVESSYRYLGQKLYQLFEAPLLQVHMVKSDRWMIHRVNPLTLNKISTDDQERVQQYASSYFARKRFQKPRLKHYKYDLAILINPNETKPPSCPGALRNFKIAANKIGFYVDFITKDDYENICEYDALFIRETTNVNDHTYEFARRAYAEGLVVIDDPWSILRCSNKIYLNERMKQNRIDTPQTMVLTKNYFKKQDFSKIKFPVVLKQPDSAFSFGVIKAENETEMTESLDRLFKTSDLIIVQEFLPSEFDWRIGILDQKPIFACKYYMAKNHWQIYNWNASKEEGEGESETLLVEDVPEQIIKIALKAANLMGDGFYGVDLKVVGNKVYVIEVNDNPNVDVGIEDDGLKDKLYENIMQVIFNRIEVLRNSSRLVAAEPD